MMRWLLLFVTLSLMACSHTPPVPRQLETPQVQLPPAPASVMVKQEADFLTLMQDFFSVKPPEPTK